MWGQCKHYAIHMLYEKDSNVDAILNNLVIFSRNKELYQDEFHGIFYWNMKILARKNPMEIIIKEYREEWLFYPGPDSSGWQILFLSSLGLAAHGA